MHCTLFSKGLRRARFQFLFCSLSIFTLPGLAQRVSLSLKEEGIEKAFRSIESQTSYRFIYSKETIKNAKPVSVQETNIEFREALARIFSGQPLVYAVEDTYVMVKAGEERADKPVYEIRGKVLDEEERPMQGVSVVVRGSGEGTATNAEGEFYLKEAKENAVLTLSFIGHETLEVPTRGQAYLLVHLTVLSRALDEAIVQAYGTTTRRLGTGNITKVSSAEIEKQPVTNPLAALEGRVPGLFITQSSGIAGSSFKVQLRGRTAIDPSITDDQPLFIIDGVPYAPNNSYMSTISSALGTPSNLSGTVKPGGLSPFASINPQDIESIEVLKDADATAIYGSRGANGVVLITTRKANSGKTGFHFGLQSGWSRPTRLLRMLSRGEYLQMRKEAFSNDSRYSGQGAVQPTSSNAYDFMVWDSTRDTDLRALLLGETARSWDAQASLSGGSEGTKFLLGGNYHRESDVFTGEGNASNASVHFNLAHTTAGKKFGATLSGNYASMVNRSFAADPTSLLELPPNILVFGPSGTLGWNEGGLFTGWDNPVSYTYSRYTAKTSNLLSNLDLGYKIFKGLEAKLSAGYHAMDVGEESITPMSALNPLQNPGRSSTFSSRAFKSYILEPRFEYSGGGKNDRIDLLFGATWQLQKAEGLSATGSGYIDDALLRSLSGAGSITAGKTFSEYRYEALFARATYTMKRRYVLNLSARRDGSSRFGENKRFANFGAAGAAWIFSEEKIFKKALHFVSFGKLRGSAGLTGNDKISDYLYLDTWRTTPNPYGGSTGLMPVKLYNPDYHWEKTTKLEVALDLGFFSDRLLFSLVWYRNRSSNQLVNYKLASTSGFTSIVKNLEALVENSGVEGSLSATLLRSKHFQWNTSVNLTIPKTKLVRFPGLAGSSYATTYVVGEPLNLIYAYRYLGVDPQTGIYIYEDLNKDGLLSNVDRQPLGTLDPKLYGGWSHSVNWGRIALDIFLQFTKGKGVNFFYPMNSAPGSIRNMPALVLERWRNPDDLSAVQQFTQNTSSGAAYNAFSLLNQSNGVYSNASYARLKTLSFSYRVGDRMLKKMRLGDCTAYISGQNLLTITSYKGGDPETQNYLRLPPLKSLVIGLRLSL